MTKKILAIIFLLCCMTAAKAQIDAHFSNYWMLNGINNPGYAGHNGKLNIVGTYSMQLVGFENAPKSMCFGADMPFKLFNKDHGVGASFFNESIGLFKNQLFAAQYAYKQKLFGGTLGIGLQIGIITMSFRSEDLELGEDSQNDPAFPTGEAEGTGFDLGAGLFYDHPLFYVGVSGKHLTSPKMTLGESGSNSEIKVSPAFYFSTGCNIKTKSPLITIKPSVFLQTDFVAYRCDLSARMEYTYREKMFYGGISYSPMTSVTLMVGGTIKGITIGYAYDMYTTKIGPGSGSHDIVLGYSTKLNFSKKGKNKHKSIRIL